MRVLHQKPITRLSIHLRTTSLRSAPTHLRWPRRRWANFRTTSSASHSDARARSAICYADTAVGHVREDVVNGAIAPFAPASSRDALVVEILGDAPRAVSLFKTQCEHIPD